MSKSQKKSSAPRTTYRFDDETMGLVEKVVDATPDDNLLALYDPASGLGYFGIPGPLLKRSLVGGRDSKRYTVRAKDFGRGVVGHVYKAWMPSQHAALEHLVEVNDRDAAEGEKKDEKESLLDKAVDVAAEEGAATMVDSEE
ncbi:hypothetical protein QJ043_07735 [Olsenella sp. YH-ols2217]|uniref:Uncharacterized protein n=1 Tax=Kribbibacterium absianum TaxID=3044210 RepID=A0ABT6ZLN8_9ACTN|nr:MULTISPECIES: hypothetical protein [unclassified Olsenella]MDJ1121959.1 hypothetical protein [Olsenella sp. YH-ols2216]MDJ1129967.1 hypothetical protein [Olsenella sp. YH-ols2217]